MESGLLQLQRSGQAGQDQGRLAGARRAQHGQEVVVGKPLLQPFHQFLAPKEELPVVPAKRIQAAERTTRVVGGRILPQGQGVEADIQSFLAEVADRVEGVVAFLTQFFAQGFSLRLQCPPQRRCVFLELGL